jgi:hypothetical protein
MKRKSVTFTGGPVDSLIVFCTNRGDYILRDQIDALHWTHVRPHVIVAVDDTRPLDAAPEDGTSPYGPGLHYIIPSRVIKGQRHLSGFKNLEAVRWALAAGLEFKVCLSVDDDAFPIGRGLDDWALPTMEWTAIDLLGVQDRVSYQNSWKQICSALAAWLPEANNPQWIDDVTPQGVFFAMIWLSQPFCAELYRRDILVPPGYERWGMWPDVYVSYIAQLLGFYTVLWGHMDAPRAPLYANHRNHMRTAPDPRILRTDFLCYHPIRYVNQFDEETLRRHYAQLRRAGRDA